MVQVSDLRSRAIPVTIGPITGPRETIDLLRESEAILGFHPSDETDVTVTSHFHGEPYLETDRCEMPPSHPCMGSASVEFTLPTGEKAAVGLVVFRDLKDEHHNVELWARGFDGAFAFTKNVPHHADIPLAEALSVDIRLDDDRKQATMPGTSSSG